MRPASARAMNLAHLLDQTARRHRDRPAIIWGERRWSWGDMAARVEAMARALVHEFGVEKGERVLVQSPNCNQMLESMLATFRAGAVWVPANHRGTPDELAWLARKSGAAGMICHARHPEHAAACPARFTIAVGEAPFGPDYDAVVAAHMGEAQPCAPVERDDPCWFFFTSGTTGRPKASVLTHGQMGFVVTNHLCDLIPGTTEEDASLVVAPLSHGAGVHQLLQVARGAASVLTEAARLDPAEAWALVERHRVTNMFTVPTILKMLVEHEAVDAHDHSSLRYVIYAGAPMYRADQVRALGKLGPVLVQYFGLGEVTGAITVLPPALHDAGDDARVGTCGHPRTAMEVEVQDEAGQALPPFETGELCVAGPAVFAGYWDDAEANARAFRDGWFRTGDLGHMDEDGFFTLTGRSSDMFISGGSNIHPREIEEKILAHPDIAEAAVLGVPDPRWGEVGVAVCVARPGAEPGTIDLAAWLDGRIARYKIPRRVVFWDALPKSGYGKITKNMIRAELERRDAEAPAGAPAP